MKKYRQLIGKAEAIIATGMPGLYRVIAFFGIQRIYSLGELGRAASAFSVAQILAYFTAIGWAGLVLVRVPAARDREEGIQRFYELLGMGGTSALVVGAGLFLYVLLFKPEVSGEEIGVILFGWSLYQLTRHYFLALRAYRRVIACDLMLLGLTAVLVMVLHRVGMAAGWPLGLALAMVGFMLLLNIGRPRSQPLGRTFEFKGLEFGFTNFLSGGIALSLAGCTEFCTANLCRSHWRPMRVLGMHAWIWVTAFGDSAVLMPVAAAVGFWLGIFRETRPMMWRWLALLCAVAMPVIASKLAFMVWGLGVSSLDFTGISGHSAMSAAVWPAFFALLWPGARQGVRVAGVAMGLLCALLIAVSRVAVHAHSWSEVLAGFCLGGIVGSAFLRRWGGRWCIQGARWPVVLTVLVALSLTHGCRFPSERLLRFVAQQLSMDSSLHARRPLHQTRT